MNRAGFSGGIYEEKRRQRDITRLPERKRLDLRLKEKNLRVWNENYQVYGVRKVWRQLEREGTSVARCTVKRLMDELGLKGVVQGKKVYTPCSDALLPRSPVRVERNFAAQGPNQLWIADFTYVATGWIGTTIDACSSLSETSPQANWKRCIIVPLRTQTRCLDSNKPVSRKSGAVHKRNRPLRGRRRRSW